MSTNNASDKIKHVIVLMLENRSFDHMLGHSGITGKDAVTGQDTKIEGVKDEPQYNEYRGRKFYTEPGALDAMEVDPGHEFPDVVEQLAGKDVSYPNGGPYPPVNNSGYVENFYKHFVNQKEREPTPKELSQVMKGYESGALPILSSLAKEFAVCDHWFSALPGPTWPNRFFAMAATSGNWAASPGPVDMGTWLNPLGEGLKFKNGSMFGPINNQSLFGTQLYFGNGGSIEGITPIAFALHEMKDVVMKPFSAFEQNLCHSSYPWSLTWIEPNYGKILTDIYKDGTSQHPNDNVRHGEALIQSVYISIRNSPLWNDSLLIITYDEHGGFYDHVAPPKVAPLQDASINDTSNPWNFQFDQLGPRVPAVIISPYIPKNTIDHREYYHSSIPATVGEIFGFGPFTNRDANANKLTALLTLDNARTDCLAELPPVSFPPPTTKEFTEEARNELLPETGNSWGTFYLSLDNDLRYLPISERVPVIDRAKKVKTKGEAYDLMMEVYHKAEAVRNPKVKKKGSAE